MMKCDGGRLGGPGPRGTSLVLVGALLCAACDANPAAPTPVSASAPQVTLTATPETIPADGASTLQLALAVADTSGLYLKQVTFTADRGTLLGATTGAQAVPLDITNVATVTLQAPTEPGMALVRANIGSVSIVRPVTFSEAYPTDLVIALDHYTVVDTGVVVTVTVQVRRPTGVPSPGARITFTATMDSVNPFGVFAGTTLTDATGKATAQYVVADLRTVTGPTTVTIRAAVATDSAGLVAKNAADSSGHVAITTTTLVILPPKS
jgi:hypothetical protein